MLPLNYAVLDVMYKADKPMCAKEVLNELKPTYGNRRPLKVPYVLEVLMCAWQNGLFEEVEDKFDEDGDFCTYYECNDLGKKIIKRYIY